MGLKDLLSFIPILALIGTVIIFSKKYIRGQQYKKLNKKRTQKDLDAFYSHFLDLGYPKSWIDEVVYILRRNSLTVLDFIPSTRDSFKTDYNWNTPLADQYSSYQMRLAGFALRKIAFISITEKDWKEFQDINGEIDNFDDLFNYFKFKTPKSHHSYSSH